MPEAPKIPDGAHFYPQPAPASEIEPMDEAVLASRILGQRALGKTYGQAAGLVLDGSDDAEGYKRVWKAVEAERKAMKAVPLDAEAKYRTALEAVAVYADVDDWIAAKKAVLGVSEIAAPKEL